MPPNDLSSEATKTARGGAFLFFGNTLSTVILALGSIILARLLGPSDYGLYSLTLATPIILVGLADAGMSYGLVREPARLISQGDYHGAEKALKLGFTVKVCFSAAASIICYAGADPIALFILNRPDLSSLLRLASLVIISQAVLTAATQSFIGLELMNYSAGIQVLYSILKSTLAPLLILVGFGLLGAISGYALGVLIAGAIGTIILFTKRDVRSVSETKGSLTAIWNALLRYSLPLYLAGLLVTVVTQYQNIVLAHFASNLEIGNFNAASNFNILFVILTYPVTNAMFPMFSKMNPITQQRDIIRTFELSTQYSSLLVLPASVAFMLFSRDLILLTYGKSYTLASYYLIFFSALWLVAGIGSGGFGSGGTIGSFLLGIGDARTVFMMNFLLLAVFIPLGPVLAWRWGVYGLIVAILVANTVPAIYGVRQASVTIGARFNLGGNAKILVAAFASALPIMMLLPFHLTGANLLSTLLDFVGKGFLYSITFLTIAPVLGAVNEYDVENLKTIFESVQIIRTLVKLVLSYETRILSITEEYGIRKVTKKRKDELT
jgi:O-antigen/teichoic acid export membrane protein